MNIHYYILNSAVRVAVDHPPNSFLTEQKRHLPARSLLPGAQLCLDTRHHRGDSTRPSPPPSRRKRGYVTCGFVPVSRVVTLTALWGHLTVPKSQAFCRQLIRIGELKPGRGMFRGSRGCASRIGTTDAHAGLRSPQPAEGCEGHGLLALGSAFLPSPCAPAQPTT